MRTKVIFFSLMFAVGALVPMHAFAQQDDEVRGAFLTTRPKASATANTNKSGANSKPNRRRPKVTKLSDTTSSPGTGPSAPAVTPKVTPQRMGLGLTLFMRDSNGLAVRTNPAREFQKGDRVRFLLETNADGYLYIFNTTDGGKPVMIYPDPELDEAGNYIQSHVPFEIPSSLAAEERLKWLAFDANPGVEKLYFVFTREPLPAVPIEDDLISFCRDNSAKCPWHPETETWTLIENDLKQPNQLASKNGEGKAQTSVEQRAVIRGIGLNRDDPEPSLIMLTASTTKNILVAALELVHKSTAMATDVGADSDNIQE